MDKKIEWFHDFMGVGYYFYDVRPNILLIFDKKKKLLDAWNKVIKWSPDDAIHMRFVEMNEFYDFILHGQSRILMREWIFLKALRTSVHYKRFKDEYDGAAKLGLALHRAKEDSYELEIFKYGKRITDVLFLSKDELARDPVVLKSAEVLHGSSQ